MARKPQGPFRPNGLRKPDFAFTPKPNPCPEGRFYMDSKGWWFTKGDGIHIPAGVRFIAPWELTMLLSATAP